MATSRVPGTNSAIGKCFDELKHVGWAATTQTCHGVEQDLRQFPRPFHRNQKLSRRELGLGEWRAIQVRNRQRPVQQDEGVLGTDPDDAMAVEVLFQGAVKKYRLQWK
jgi:hypothetical protein